MAVITPWAMDALSVDGELQPAYNGAALRQIFSGLLGTDTTPTRARPGVLSGLDVLVLDDVAYVDRGLVVVTSADGAFITGLETDQAIPLEVRDATNARKDRLVLRVYHDATTREARLEVLTGTPAPNPQPPSTPAGAESLGTFDVPNASGGTSTFTPGQRYTAARGGIIQVPNTDALNRTADPTEGLEARVAGQDGTWVYRGDGWQREGVYSISGAAVFAPTDGTIREDAFATITRSGGSAVASISLALTGRAIENGAQLTRLGNLTEAMRPRVTSAGLGYSGNRLQNYSMDADTLGVALRYTTAAVPETYRLFVNATYPLAN